MEYLRGIDVDKNEIIRLLVQKYLTGGMVGIEGYQTLFKVEAIILEEGDEYVSFKSVDGEIFKPYIEQIREYELNIFFMNDSISYTEEVSDENSNQ